MYTLRGKKVLVVGLGRSGIPAAAFLAKEGAIVSATDLKSEGELMDAIRILSPLGVKLFFGKNPTQLFLEQDLIVASPGVPLDIEGIVKARERGIPVISEMELVLDRIRGKIVGITGTNGKSTTTVLIGEMLKAAGKRVWVGGNLGTPLISGIEAAESAEVVVLEISSYQLETTPHLRCNVAVWLNATPDHLDRYRSFEEYVGAKALIGMGQSKHDFIVYNMDDPVVSREVEEFKAIKLPFSTSSRLAIGAYYEGERLNILLADGPSLELNASLSALFGRHNKENIAAAALASAILGASKADIELALKEFKGLPHRIQFVRELDGVRYFDDSKGTNVGAVIKSLESFNSSIILIAGGKDKNTGYSDLREYLKGKVKKVLAIGEAAPRIAKEIGDIVAVEICKTMDEAVRKAHASANSGDVVLLSPACSSFDMFKDYRERGEVFVRCVNSLGEGR